MLQALTGSDQHYVHEVVKVRAHQELDVTLPAREYFLRPGNSQADKLANLGRKQHPGPSPA
eukprot:240445-Pyramimonas_sp.AAC.1